LLKDFAGPFIKTTLCASVKQVATLDANAGLVKYPIEMAALAFNPI